MSGYKVSSSSAAADVFLQDPDKVVQLDARLRVTVVIENRKGPRVFIDCPDGAGVESLIMRPVALHSGPNNCPRVWAHAGEGDSWLCLPALVHHQCRCLFPVVNVNHLPNKKQQSSQGSSTTGQGSGLNGIA